MVWALWNVAGETASSSPPPPGLWRAGRPSPAEQEREKGQDSATPFLPHPGSGHFAANSPFLLFVNFCALLWQFRGPPFRSFVNKILFRHASVFSCGPAVRQTSNGSPFRGQAETPAPDSYITQY